MKTSVSAPADKASSTAYWISGLSTIGSISLGLALVTGRNLVPRPATGKTTAFTGCAMVLLLLVSSSKHNGIPNATPSDISHTLLAQLDDRVCLEAIPGVTRGTMPVEIPPGKAAFIAAIFLGLREQCANFL